MNSEDSSEQIRVNIELTHPGLMANSCMPSTMSMDSSETYSCMTPTSGLFPGQTPSETSSPHLIGDHLPTSETEPQMDPPSSSRITIEATSCSKGIMIDTQRTLSLSKDLAETVSKVTFPFFDPEKLKGIELGLPFPMKQSMFLPPSPRVVLQTPDDKVEVESTMSEASSSRPNNQLVHVSHCRRHARQARQHILFKIGMRSHISETKKLLAAVQSGELAKVSSLLNNGVSANVSDQKKRTPLHIAASQGRFAIASLLIAMNAEPNKQDILGNTPLHLAVCRGDHHVVKLLMESGANIHLRDNAGRTPLSIVQARLNTLRKDRHISTDKLKGEFLHMWDYLRVHSSSQSSEQELCDLMQNISTREQADEVADIMIGKMSQLCLANEKRHQPAPASSSMQFMNLHI